MLQFVPFEDDWEALERLRPEDLVPYRVGLLLEPMSPAQAPHTGSGAAIPGSSPAVPPASDLAHNRSPAA